LALDVLEKVSDLLRYALRASRTGMLTMQDELDFAERYLSVQSMRHGDRLQIECRIEADNWSEIDCPPLLFQPLIENALRHGIESAPGPNRVTMSVHCKEEDVVIEIVNDIDENMPPLPGTGMGLSLVRDRLHAVYGMRASLSTERQGRQFTAKVRFPADDYHG
jgi:LytS/YehU family sensor histidine kinase